MSAATLRPTGIRCGHCKGYHETVALVRLCAQRAGVGTAPAPTETVKVPFPAKTWEPVEVPVGKRGIAYYALEEDGVTKFYRVDRPVKGKWAGRTFVKVQASDDFHRIGGAAANLVLVKIAIDIAAASARYGAKIGRCSRCNKTLTDEISRSYGIGPYCRGGG